MTPHPFADLRSFNRIPITRLVQERFRLARAPPRRPVLNYLGMRLFVGIPLAPKVVSELSAVVTKLKSNGDHLRWTTSESWHITLQFLGNTDQEHYQRLVARLAEVHSRSVSVQLGELGFFERAGIFIADVAPSPEFVSLAGRVMAATSLCGFVSETGPFYPHITLARAKGEGRSRLLRALQQKIHNQPAFSPFVASEYLLYESHLASAGSTYEICHCFPLGVRQGQVSSDH
ncbi:MAG: RNA 2',3'-cyclic phosphodiesterase [Terracidiphilus sp.]